MTLWKILKRSLPSIVIFKRVMQNLGSAFEGRRCDIHGRPPRRCESVQMHDIGHGLPSGKPLSRVGIFLKSV